eukprot:Gb_14032 [translate_table: standard]
MFSDVVDTSLGIWISLSLVSFTFFFTIILNSMGVVESSCLC